MSLSLLSDKIPEVEPIDDNSDTPLPVVPSSSEAISDYQLNGNDDGKSSESSFENGNGRCTSELLSAASSQSLNCGMKSDKASFGLPIAIDSQAPPPFHVLMINDNDSKIDGQTRRKILLNRRFKTDYLSLRHRAFQDAKLHCDNRATAVHDDGEKIDFDDNQPESWWSGATDVEQALASCCTLHPGDYYLIGSLATDAANRHNNSSKPVSRKRQYAPANEIDNNGLVAGALSVDMVGKFVGILAMHCHDIRSRTLALAILEQTQEADEIDLMDHQSYITNHTDQQDVTQNESKVVTSKKPRKKKSTNIELNTNPLPPTKYERISHKKPERLTKLLSAGGLKILSHWLVEATRTITEEIPEDESPKLIKANLPDSGVVVKSSSSGPLLLPLLKLLHKFPFDLKAVTESKINKEIKRLCRQIDARVDEEKIAFLGGDDDAIVKDLKETIILKPFSDPIAGGSDVLEVQSKLHNIMESWERQVKEDKNNVNQRRIVPDESTFKSPFSGICNAILKRFDEVKGFEANGVSLNTAPAWLTTLSKKRQNLSNSPSRPSLVDDTAISIQKVTDAIARQERDNERTAIMKQDLEKMQEERKKLFLRLKQLHQLHSNGGNDSIDDASNIIVRKKHHVANQTTNSMDEPTLSTSHLSSFELSHRLHTTPDEIGMTEMNGNVVVVSSEGTIDEEMEELFG